MKQVYLETVGYKNELEQYLDSGIYKKVAPLVCVLPAIWHNLTHW